jgi:hypothetical protein
MYIVMDLLQNKEFNTIKVIDYIEKCYLPYDAHYDRITLDGPEHDLVKFNKYLDELDLTAEYV